MNRHFTKGMVLAALVGMFALTTGTKAEAAFMAYICDDAACTGGGDIIVTDEGAGDNAGGLAGVIVATGAVNGYEFTLNTAQSKPALSSGMDLNYTVTNLFGGSGGSVWLYAMDTDFAGPESLTATLGGTSDNGSITAIICGGDDNDDPRSPVNDGPCTTATDNTTPGIAIAFPYSATANPYSLTIGVQVSLTGTGTTATGDFRVIPEPASVALFGLGLAGLAAYRRRQAR